MKLTPKAVFIIIIAAAVLVPLLVFGWNELQKEPFDMVMYGAEIDADGNVIQETEFRLKGYLKPYNGASNTFIPYRIYLYPVTFPNTQELKQELYETETFLMMSGNIHAPYYTANLFTTDPITTGIGTFDVNLCNQFCCCVIKTEGRYFIGSIRQSDTIQDILALFPELMAE